MLNMNFIESSETANEAMISIKPRGGGKISENGPMQRPIKQKGQYRRYMGEDNPKKIGHGEDIQNFTFMMPPSEAKQDKKREVNGINSDFGVNNFSGSKSKQLSQEERRIIESISKIFMSQKPKPKRILVRLNELQRNFDSQNDCGENASSCRIDNISISRLPQQGDEGRYSLEQQIGLKGTSEFPECPEIAGVIINVKGERKIRKRISSPSIVSQSVKSSVQLEKIKEKYTKVENLQVQRTVAIKYMPEGGSSISQEGQSTTHKIFTRFRRGKQQLALSRSFVSEDLLDELMSQEGMVGQGGGFTRLTEISLFARRRQLQRGQNALTTKANELLAQQHQNLKIEFGVESDGLKDKLNQFKHEMEIMQRQSQRCREAEMLLRSNMDILNKRVKDLRQLNQVYLRENNKLKEKVKQNEKIVQDLRKEIIAREAYSASGNPKDSRIDNQHPQYFIQPNPKPIEFGKRAQSPKVKLQRSSTIEVDPLRFNSTQLIEENMAHATINNLTDRSQNKLVNVRSVQVLPRPSFEGQSYDREASNQNSVASQRTGGIRKNNLRKEQPTLQSKNLVRVKSTDMEEESYGGHIVRGRREQNSVSNYSNTSGKSLSQRVGYINKPSVIEARKGMFVDYMLEGAPDNIAGHQPQNQDEDKGRPVVQKERQRFRYNAKK